MKLKILFILITCLVLTACGTKTPDASTNAPRAITPISTPTVITGYNAFSSTPEAANSSSELIPSSPTPSSLIIPAQAHAPSHHLAGEAISLDHIAMADTVHGWGTSGAEVFVTADGAHTWKEITPPQALSPQSTTQAQGYFLNQTDAWVIFSTDNQIPSDAVVWHTTDSGDTWTPSVPLNHEAYGERVWAEFAAFDAAHAWLMIRGVYVGAGTHYDAQFFRTVDSGINWIAQVGDIGNDYTGMVFDNADIGLLTWQTTGAYAPAPPQYALTKDGAVNWSIQEFPPPPDQPGIFESSPYCESYQPRFLTDHSIRVLIGCFDEYNPPHVFSSYLYASNDLGTTWTSTRLPDSILASDTTMLFFDPNEGLLLSREIYFTHDNGTNWSSAKTVYWDGQFSFPDASNGWAIARSDSESALVHTQNLGSTWDELKPVIAP